MKKTKYLVWMLAAGLMAGCSDDLENGGGTSVPVAKGEKGYVKIAINLPTASNTVTRAANDNFDDGSESEYDVKKATLYIFQGDVEKDAMLEGSYPLPINDWVEREPDDDNVTTQQVLTQEVTYPEGTGQIWGLIVLNEPAATYLPTLTPTVRDGNGKVTTEGTKFSTLYTNLITANDATPYASGTTGFTMTNSPLATLPGSQSDLSKQTVQTLVPLEIHKYEDEAAETADADNFYMERVVAKITVSGGEKFEKGTDSEYYADVDAQEGDSYYGDKVKFEGWFPNITNKSTKLVRDVTDASTWATYSATTAYSDGTFNRFFGTKGDTYMPDRYRIYWAIDGNYDEAYKASDFNIYEGTAENEPETQYDFSTPAYCLENTFNAANMNKNRTTSVWFKMTYIFSEEEGREGRTFYMYGADKFENTFIVPKPDETLEEPEKDDFETVINNILREKLDETAQFTIKVNAGAKGGYYSTATDMKDLFLKVTDSAAGTTGTLSGTEAETLASLLGEVRVYQNGTVYYYSSPIEHFGDIYTPAPEEDENGFAYTDKDHLGRYGVVRNNWYELVISSISGPGMPEMDVPDEDDDKDHYYIKCAVNVLSWAKRSQQVDL